MGRPAMIVAAAGLGLGLLSTTTGWAPDRADDEFSGGQISRDRCENSGGFAVYLLIHPPPPGSCNGGKYDGYRVGPPTTDH